jgi:hypothetical protein
VDFDIESGRDGVDHRLQHVRFADDAEPNRPLTVDDRRRDDQAHPGDRVDGLLERRLGRRLTDHE